MGNPKKHRGFQPYSSGFCFAEVLMMGLQPNTRRLTDLKSVFLSFTEHPYWGRTSARGINQVPIGWADPLSNEKSTRTGYCVIDIHIILYSATLYYIA